MHLGTEREAGSLMGRGRSQEGLPSGDRWGAPWLGRGWGDSLAPQRPVRVGALGAAGSSASLPRRPRAASCALPVLGRLWAPGDGMQCSWVTGGTDVDSGQLNTLGRRTRAQGPAGREQDSSGTTGREDEGQGPSVPRGTKPVSRETPSPPVSMAPHAPPLRPHPGTSSP